MAIESSLSLLLFPSNISTKDEANPNQSSRQYIGQKFSSQTTVGTKDEANHIVIYVIIDILAVLYCFVYCKSECRDQIIQQKISLFRLSCLSRIRPHLQCAQVVKHCEGQPTSKKKRKEKSFTYSKTYFTMPRKNRTSHGAQYALIAHPAELELTATAVMNNSLV